MYQCFLRTAAAEFDQVEYYMGELARLGEGLDDANTLLFGMVHLSNTLMMSLEADAAVEQGRRALAKAEQFGHLKFLAEILTIGLPWAHLQRGEIAEATECVERGMEIALRIGDRGSEMFAAVLQGQVAQSQGRFDDALALFRRAEEAAAATGMPPYVALARCVTGTCYQQIGGPFLERAVEIHREALELARMPMGDQMGAQIWSEVGRCFLAAGDVDGAEELFRMARDRTTMLMHVQRPAALRGLCEVALARGNLEEADRLLEELRAYVSEHSIEGFRVRLLITESQVAQAHGDHHAALAALDRCEALVLDQGFERTRLDLIRARIVSLKALGDSDGQTGAMAAAEQVIGSILGSLRDQSVRDAFSASMLEMLEPAG
jgi:ATP/maltotriose-dependent transcriptional regulator MalT